MVREEKGRRRRGFQLGEVLGVGGREVLRTSVGTLIEVLSSCPNPKMGC